MTAKVKSGGGASMIKLVGEVGAGVRFSRFEGATT
jgi:hypothetical protein